MDLPAQDLSLHSIPNVKPLNRHPLIFFPNFRPPLRHQSYEIRSSTATSPEEAKNSQATTSLVQPGGKMVAELVGAFNQLTERMNIYNINNNNNNGLSTCSSRLLFKTLKLCIPLLQSLPVSPDRRSPLSKALSVAVLLAELQAKRLKAIMVAAAELAALRLKDLPSAYHNSTEIDQRDSVFFLLDKNGDGRISIEELMEVMEELGAQREDAKEMMQLLDSNSDGSLSSDEFDLFQKQVDLMRNIADRDVEYKILLEEKLPMADESGLIQIYRNELGNGVLIS